MACESKLVSRIFAACYLAVALNFRIITFELSYLQTFVVCFSVCFANPLHNINGLIMFVSHEKKSRTFPKS